MYKILRNLKTKIFCMLYRLLLFSFSNFIALLSFPFFFFLLFFFFLILFCAAPHVQMVFTAASDTTVRTVSSTSTNLDAKLSTEPLTATRIQLKETKQISANGIEVATCITFLLCVMLLVLFLFYFVGVITFFAACLFHEDSDRRHLCIFY